MQILRFGSRAAACLISANLFLACQGNGPRSGEPAPTALREVPSIRLNYRYEADVPAPATDPAQPSLKERNAAIQADFDATRQFEILDRTYASPDKKWVVAIYHRLSDLPGDYRLDTYSPEGKLVRKLTSDAMAVHFPETLRWSPDSGNLAFLAAFRRPSAEPALSPTPAPDAPEPETPDEPIEATPTAEPVATPTPAPPTGILVLRTEQVYIASADGAGVKPLTQTDGLKYYYLAWSPDSSMIAAMAATDYEWSVMRAQAESRGEHLIPRGRPRIIEKNGRERRLDDNITNVWPVWSPDSSKVATAFETQVRIYDAAGVNPTQAAIPLRNQMLLSAKAYDEAVARGSDANADANAVPTPQLTETSILPDEKDLVSYNPIVEMIWSTDDLLYMKTAFVRRTLNEADSAISFLRWHRIVLSAQIPAAR